MNLIKVMRTSGKRIFRYTAKNSNWILAALASLGVAGTAISFTKATVKAVKLCEEKQVHGKKEVLKTVWKLYIPGVGFALATTIAICGNAHINARRLATVSGLYVASQADLKAFKEKTKEMLGEKKEKKIEDEVERDKVAKADIPPEHDIVKTGHGNQLFIFGWTGGWFRACPEWVELIEKEINDELKSEVDNILYMHRLIEKLGLPECQSGNLYWDYAEMMMNGTKKIALDITTCNWMEVNGKQEMVCTLNVSPWPTGY